MWCGRRNPAQKLLERQGLGAKVQSSLKPGFDSAIVEPGHGAEDVREQCAAFLVGKNTELPPGPSVQHSKSRQLLGRDRPVTQFDLGQNASGETQ